DLTPNPGGPQHNRPPNTPTAANRGKRGAAVTWWENGEESKYSTFGLEPHNTVFQSEMYALFRAVKMARESRVASVSILSDSRSSLDLLRSPSVTHHLALQMKGFVREIREEGREYRAVTKVFFPDALAAKRTLREENLTPLHIQILTGHGGFSAYLHRFHLKSSPACVCDPDCDETVWHLLLECPRFQHDRMELEQKIDIQLSQSTLHVVMEKQKTRTPFLAFASKVASVAVRANKTQNGLPSVPTTQRTRQNTAVTSHTTTTLQPTHPHAEQQPTVPAVPLPAAAPAVTSIQSATNANAMPIPQFLAGAARGTPCLRLRGVALFMNRETEKLGISFCVGSSRAGARVHISPGLAALINGSTTKASMKGSKYAALPQVVIDTHRCRLVRFKGKTVALLEWSEETPFAQANRLLQKIGEAEELAPRTISVDAMAVGWERGDVADRYGCLKASEHHEVIVYEDRGETLSYLRTPRDPTTTTTGGMSPATGPTTPSGSERAQQKAAAEKAAKEQAKTTSPENRAQQKSRLKAIGNFLNALLPSTSHNSSTTKQESALKRFFKKSREEPKKPAPVPTRADKGHVSPPTLAVNSGVTDHMKSAFLEYVAVVRATKEVHLMTCRKIMLTFQRGTEGLLGVLLKEAGAAVYDNATSQEESERTGTARFETPKGDSIVVTAKCTRIMLEDRILEMAQAISGTAEPPALQGGWAVPKYSGHFNEEEDVVATTTTEAAKDLREKLAHRLGQRTRTRVRTMASILSNGFRAHDKCHRIIVDEALMNHFGAIVMAARLSGASEVVLVGDVNQLPFLDRENLFQLNYTRPNVVAAITHELSCTHRNPMDVAYTLGEIYPGIYSSRTTQSRVHSLRVERYTGAKIPRLAQNTLFLVHTQEEKADLASQGYGSGEGSRLLTIHEAQGLTSDCVLVINTKTRRLQIHESVSHAVVAVSRHRVSCVYYTDDADDAAGRLIKRAMEANTKMVVDYNLKMAMKHRDAPIIEEMLHLVKSLVGKGHPPQN
ncbi:hypothetical protein HW555_013311, partial [Spodoptera exigua]